MDGGETIVRTTAYRTEMMACLHSKEEEEEGGKKVLRRIGRDRGKKQALVLFAPHCCLNLPDTSNGPCFCKIPEA